jgi:hypothetical protein
MTKRSINFLNDIMKKGSDTSLLYSNPYDNCLLCKHSKIEQNTIAGFVRWLGFKEAGDKLNAMFPVVLCNNTHDLKPRYIANPMKRPGWCRRERH